MYIPRPAYAVRIPYSGNSNMCMCFCTCVLHIVCVYFVKNTCVCVCGCVWVCVHATLMLPPFQGLFCVCVKHTHIPIHMCALCIENKRWESSVFCCFSTKKKKRKDTRGTQPQTPVIKVGLFQQPQTHGRKTVHATFRKGAFAPIQSKSVCVCVRVIVFVFTHTLQYMCVIYILF